jgi:hypothetical protein
MPADLPATSEPRAWVVRDWPLADVDGHAASAWLAYGEDGELAGAAEPAGRLWRGRIDWQCRDRRLRVSVLATNPLPLPEGEASEPVVGALARLVQAVRGHHALLMLDHPAEAMARERIAWCEGVRLFGIGTPDDLAAWDAALSIGLPIFGIRDRVRIISRTAASEHVLAALAYGQTTCTSGTLRCRIAEDRQGVAFAADHPVEASVIIHDGFEAAVLRGQEGRWDDLGSEGYVRLEVHGAAGCCWSQPRFVAGRPRSAHGAGHGH